MPFSPLPTNHADGVGEVINASTVNDLAQGVNDLNADFMPKAGGAFTGNVGMDGQASPITALDVGTGANQHLYTPGIEPQKTRIRHGTTAAPITSSGPTFKVSRTEELTEATIEAIQGVGTDGGEQVAAIHGSSRALISAEVQPVGVLGTAATTSTMGNAGNDACGIYGIGRIQGTGANGTGLGATLVGRRDVSTGRALACEMHAANFAGVDTPYISTGFSSGIGVWVNCSGTADSSAALVVSNGFGRQFEVGLAFTGQVTNAKTGGARVASIRDDGNATTVFDVNGSHTDGIDLTGATFTGAAIKLKAGTTAADGIDFGGAGLYRDAPSSLYFAGAFKPGRVELQNAANAGFIQAREQTSVVGAPSADHLRIYAKDNGSGLTKLYLKDSAGTEFQVATV